MKFSPIILAFLSVLAPVAHAGPMDQGEIVSISHFLLPENLSHALAWEPPLLISLCVGLGSIAKPRARGFWRARKRTL